jgi:hypothetical protein
MVVRRCSIFCGVAGSIRLTFSKEQFVAVQKSEWQMDAGAVGLDSLSFHKSAITSNTVCALQRKVFS